MPARDGESKLRQDAHLALRKGGFFVSAVEGAGFGGTPGLPDSTWIGRVTPEAFLPLTSAQAVYDDQNKKPIVVEGKTEYKVLRGNRMGKRALASEEPVTTGLEHFTQQQRNWLREYARAGGRGTVMVRFDSGFDQREHWYYVFEGEFAALHLGKDLLFRDFDRHNRLGFGQRTFPTPDRLVRALSLMGS